MADQDVALRVENVSFAEALGERYLAYAMSTITSRSLPDVRDGLKPVQRRLLFAMRQLRLDPDAGFKKCARVVGDVIGKYHPHGDAAVYDALVRLAQEFSVRYPLIEGQGNFGNIDGDNAAAMRYTEARLTDYAVAMLDGIDEDAVDFRENYDGSENEPALLPARVPNLLCNGATGIAVGMATSIPPHNLHEVCDALLHVLKSPDATIRELVELIPGPDFPGGGILVEDPESVLATYSSGRGSFRVRARWHVEKLPRGRYEVVVTEIPYQVQKGRLIERIADLLTARELPLLGDLRDESTEDTRLVLEPKSRTLDPEMLMESLFRATDLESRVSLNMNVLDADTVPRVMNLRQILLAYLEHREEVLVRRTRHRLGKIEHRLEILAGYLIAYLNIDEVIRLIREEDRPKPVMMDRWDLTEVQAEAILDMRLRALRKLEEIAIKDEHHALTEEKTDLQELLQDPDRRRDRIAEDITSIQQKFGEAAPGGARRTEIGNSPVTSPDSPELFIEQEPLTVVCSQKGWIRTLKGHLEDASTLRYKDGDREKFIRHVSSTDRLLIFATNGRFFTLSADRLPRGRGHGEPLRLMVDLPNDQDIVSMFVHSPGERILVASGDGRGFVVAEDDIVAQTKAGRQVLNTGSETEAVACAPVRGDMVAVIGENRKLLLFPLSELPEMSRGRGVRMQRYNEGGLMDVTTFKRAVGLQWSTRAGVRTQQNIGDWMGKRAQAGRGVMRGFPRNGLFGNFEAV